MTYVIIIDNKMFPQYLIVNYTVHTTYMYVSSRKYLERKLRTRDKSEFIVYDLSKRFNWTYRIHIQRITDYT